MWLQATVEELGARGDRHRTSRNKDTGMGIPQGAPISPLLSNLYMRRFILGWKVLGHESRLNAYLVSYADDLVICCRGTSISIPRQANRTSISTTRRPRKSLGSTGLGRYRSPTFVADVIPADPRPATPWNSLAK